MPDGRRVLVVDDEQGQRVSTSLILRQAGHDVTEAASGEEALDLVRLGDFDAVIMDVRMPGMGGMAALEAIRSIRPVPVYLVTGYAIEDLVGRARRAGAAAVLRKPVDFDDLLDVVRRAVRSPPARREP